MDLDNGRVVFGDPTKKDPAKVVDPVCGMEFDPAQAVAVADRNGVIYYFCSMACKQRFVEAPDDYVSPAASP